jgi:hypothetical protein
MRRIYQFDGIDRGVLSIGECLAPEQVAICITDHNGNEAQVLLSRDDFRALCGLSYDIHWAIAPAPERDPCEQQPREEVEEETLF